MRQRMIVRLVIILLGAPTIVVNLVAQAALIDDTKLPRFEVASVKLADPAAAGRSVGTPPGRFFMHDAELVSAVGLAFYGFDLGQPSKLPDIVQRGRFTIEARMPEGTPASDLSLMVRALLVDRFKLRYHTIEKEEDGYALTTAGTDARVAPGLRQSREDCATRLTALADKKDVPPLPPGTIECGIRNSRGAINAGGLPMATLVRLLSDQAQAPMIDETGMTGRFDVDLRFAPGSSGSPRIESQTADASPSIFAAVQEQLGLKLIPRKIPVKRVVIDHIEAPEPD